MPHLPPSPTPPSPTPPSPTPPSHTAIDALELWLDTRAGDRRLALLAPAGHPALERFEGSSEPATGGATLKLCPTTPANAAALRATLSWLTPVPLGLVTSAGFGDRLGLATPGHVRALRQSGGAIAPIFAQQSIREMTRTGRTPRQVLDDATWGTFEAGWRRPVGADADHLKTEADIDRCAAAGFSFYTLDPGEHVNADADTATPTGLAARLDELPWEALESRRADLERRYLGRRVAQDSGLELVFEAENLHRAAVKYGGAVAHVVRLYRHLKSKGVAFELEVSVDETDTPTSPLEHAYVALELRRLGVEWVSLAPRFVGSFQKGIDYLGDLGALEQDIARHAALARALGPYKLSLHSGSDKFSVYAMCAEATAGLVHLKTAGTSYLEALRVAARVDPELFRRMATLARERFEHDKKSYVLAADLARVPDPAALSDAELPELLEQLDARQVLHVTFGSILDRFRDDLLALLRRHDDAYREGLARHFDRHLAPFAAHARTRAAPQEECR